MTGDSDNESQLILMLFGPKLTQPCGTSHSQDRAEQASADSASACLTMHSDDCDWASSPSKNPPQEASSGKPFSVCSVEPVVQGVLYATNGSLILTRCAPTQDANTGTYVSTVATMQGWLTNSTEQFTALDAVTHSSGR